MATALVIKERVCDPNGVRMTDPQADLELRQVMRSITPQSGVNLGVDAQFVIVRAVLGVIERSRERTGTSDREPDLD